MPDTPYNPSNIPSEDQSSMNRSSHSNPDHHVDRTGASEVLIALSGFFVILLLIVIFIMQNMDNVRITFLWMHGSIPLALAMLLSVITGALLMALAAGARVLQLRHTAARHRKDETQSDQNYQD